MAVEYQLNLPFDVQFETGYRTGTLIADALQKTPHKLVPVQVFAAW